MSQPTVFLTLNTGHSQSFYAFDEASEIIEANDLDANGQPDWSEGGICDVRGCGSDEGFLCLHAALTNAEKNAKSLGIDVQRIPA